MACKITLIGAGSVVFAKTLIGDILQFPELSDAHICLMDIDPARLKVADVMMKRVAETLGVKATVTSTMDQKEAVKDAKYVICTIQVGGYKPSTMRDFDIPKKYGLEQTIADTLGVGGVFRALRTIPVINQIAKDIADHAHPDCLLLNYTNPMAMNCMAVDAEVGIPHVGLCHSVFGTARMLANHTHLPMEDVSYQVAGINHMAFFLKFQYKGRDAYPLLYKVLEDKNRDFELVRYEMMRRTGYFVTESSEHQSEYVPYFIHHGQEMIDKFKVPLDEYPRRCEGIMASWKDTEAKLIGEGDHKMVVGEPSHEYGSYIIHSRETNTLRTVYGNVPNRGIIKNLPDDCCVEVPCQVDAIGLQPTMIGNLPPQLASMCMTNVNVQQLTVQAALTGKREHIYHAVMLDPHTSATLPLDKIWAMCDELIEAHQSDGFLGEFEPVIANTGRSYAGVGDQLIARAKARGLRFDQVGSGFELEVEVDNPSQQDATFDVAIELENDAVAFESTSATVNAPAGQTVVVTLPGKVNAEVEDMLLVKLTASDENVLCVDTMLRPYPVIAANDAGAAEFKIDLSGFPCAAGSLQRDGDNMVIHIRVEDSDIQPTNRKFFLGSGAEFFFADPTAEPVKHFMLLPDLNGEVSLVDGDRNPVAGAQVEFTKKELFYEAKITVSAALVNATQDTFFFDCSVNLGALGDAHSGGRSSLSHGANTKEDMTKAHLIDLSPALASV
ncbi:alpha-glucosidase/alpha-galactosidase [Cerasicoccus maritimus]|uniref:alpha-glucosidase/alpha-galactosidase n=1 Tax=Cerasicoccus maritimus TaxID=490089 RepID=UPI0028525DEE|nr:alpha-glucosidase/alpha-galactosidase [Cerasicoccus maritimus]